jgi:outer membrane lipoprotein-sorting protein
MKRITKPAGLLLLCWCLSSAAAALAQVGSAQQQLEQFSAGLETLHAKFEQKVIGTDGEVADESSGEMWLSRPHKFRWAYGGESGFTTRLSSRSPSRINPGKPLIPHSLSSPIPAN